MSVEPILFVITPVDHTDVNVQPDLLLALIQWTHKIQFVSVRTKHSRNFSSINSRSRLHLQKLWASYINRGLNWKSIYNFPSWWADDLYYFFFRDFMEVLNQCCSRKCKGSVLKIAWRNLSSGVFKKILTHLIFSSLFAPPRADFLLWYTIKLQ